MDHLTNLLLEINTTKEESEHECTDFLYDGGEYWCVECFKAQVRYIFPSYSDMKYHTVKLQQENYSRRLFHDRFCKFVEQYKIGYNCSGLCDDYLQFKDAFDSINIGLDKRTNMIKFELIMCFLFRKRGFDFKIQQFDELLYSSVLNKNTNKLSALAFCWQVLSNLGWEKTFYLCNKETMEQLKNQIKQFVESLGEDQRAEEMILSVERALLPYYFRDTCDPQTNTCAYVYKRGKPKGEVCGKRCKSIYCYDHSKRVLKEIELEK